MPAGSTVVNALKTVEFYYDEADSQTGCSNSFRIGRMSRFTDESGSTKLCYDQRGNVLRKTQITSNITLVLSMQYSAADRLIGMTYPSGTTASYGRDSQGRVISVNINGSAFITGVTYLPFGPMSQITFQNGKTLSKNYDQNYDIDSIVSTATGGLNLDYSVDEVGNIKQVNQSGTVFNLNYDKLYRLLSVKDQNLALIEEFSYDKTGNRITKKVGSNPILNYSYPAANHKLIDAGNGARAFDANGNITTLPRNISLGYDERNRLSVSATDAALYGRKYNARGERVEKTAAENQSGGSSKTIGGGCIGNGPTPELFIYSEADAMLGHYDLCTPFDEDVVYIDSTPVARVFDQVIYPLEADHLGSPRVMQASDGTGSLWTWNLLGNSPTGSNAFGEQLPTGKQVFNLRFPGQYSDGDGLHDNYFRDYEAGTGRYVESDPIGLRGGISTYGYVGATPLSRIDPKGLESVGCWSYGTCHIPPPPPPPPGALCGYRCETNFTNCLSNCFGALNPPVLNFFEAPLIAAFVKDYNDKTYWVRNPPKCGFNIPTLAAIDAGWKVGSGVGCTMVCTVCPCSYD